MPGNQARPEQVVAELIEQLGRFTHGAGFAGGLNPAQWRALRYFARANHMSCTVSAFAEYHGTTRGTASQTVKALVDKGYLQRRAVAVDQRSFRLALTGKARGCVDEDPMQRLVEACSALTPDERSRIASGLDIVLGRLRDRRGGREFGVCRACRNLCREEAPRQGVDRYRCGLVRRALGSGELEQICCSFEAGTDTGPEAVRP